MTTVRKKAYVILDGTVLLLDRTATDQPYYSGKKKHHGMNVQVLADPQLAVCTGLRTRCPGPCTI